MDRYQHDATRELNVWKKQMQRNPSFFNSLSKRVQTKINSWIPEKVHNAITVTIKQMIRGVLFGAKHTTTETLLNANLRDRGDAVRKKIEKYRNPAAVEGGITGAGGILLGLADFPILIGIKLKLLFEI